MTAEPAMFRRASVIAAYCVFLLVLVELALRLGGYALLRSQTMRETDAARTAATFRILAIGESTTFGLNVKPEEAYPAQLERMLNDDSDVKVVVINKGVPGQTSTSILRTIDLQLREYGPQLVVSMFGVNDSNEALNDVSSRRWFGHYVPEAFVRLRIFRLATIVRDYVFSGAVVTEDGAWNFFDPGQTAADGGWVQNWSYQRQLELNYDDVIDKIEASGARIVIMSYMRANHRVQNNLESIARERNVPFLDLYATETDAPEYFTEDKFHPNALGHRIIATKLYDLLKREVLLPKRADVASSKLPEQ